MSENVPEKQSDVTTLSTSECLQRLREAPVGRLAVVVDGMPEIFPVNHIVDHGTVVFRSNAGTKLAGAAGRPVAFEVDGYDADTGIAWSVIVKGIATEATRLHEVLDSMKLPVYPWQSSPKPHFVRIEPDDLSGRSFEVVESARPGSAV